MPEPFLDLLHDASLMTIQFDWDNGCCTAKFNGGPRLPGAFTITWSRVTTLNVPRMLAWGPSVSVLSASEPSPGSFELQMQSGDIITVAAVGVALLRSSE
jgi:hypothetical protein